jgi:PAS domain S-box-containing protein
VVAYRLLHADGHSRWVEERGRPVFDDSGELRFLEGIILEITDRKLLEKEVTLRRVIQQAAQEWRLTFDTVESPILVVDNSGRIRRLNRAARDLAGLSWEECEGLLVGAVSDGEPWAEAEALVSEALTARGKGPLYRLTSSDDKNWDLSAILSPRFAEERVILIMQDVTRIVELEDSLRRGEKLAAMGALVGGVAHEVRNPLFGISASLDAMRASFASDEQLEPYLEVLRSQVRRMTDLMNGLLEYGRSTAAERSLGSLEEIVEKSFTDCAALARERGVEMEGALEVDGWMLPMNREGLVSLFTNLVSNAVQHSPMSGAVVVTARVVARSGRHEEGAEHWVDCAVRDSGPGFAEDALARACEPFFTRRRGGMGLGLAIVERIVDDHGGRLVLGNHPAGGAEVRVRLPCVAASVGNEASVASV